MRTVIVELFMIVTVASLRQISIGLKEGCYCYPLVIITITIFNRIICYISIICNKKLFSKNSAHCQYRFDHLNQHCKTWKCVLCSGITKNNRWTGSASSVFGKLIPKMYLLIRTIREFSQHRRKLLS